MGFELNQFTVNISAALSPQQRDRWLAEANSDVAFGCIRRFARVEGDVSSSNPKGLGRVSSASFPRLGGLLAQEVAKRGAPADAIEGAVEQTLQAGYLAVIGFTKAGERGRIFTDAEALWNEWIPKAYVSVAGSVMDAIFDVAAFGEYWNRLLQHYGLAKAAKAMSKVNSDVGRSIGGLCAVGASLAFVERQPSS